MKKVEKFRLDHIQLAMPRGEEAAIRRFWVTALGFDETPKPNSRGGCWFASGAVKVHYGVEDDFVPARKAHPAFEVDDLDEIAEAIGPVEWDESMPGRRRFYVYDPFGNRLEFISAG